MTERERYRVRGLYYFVAGNFSKCIEEYSALVTRYPADNIGQGNLAACYARLRNFSKAVEAEAHAVEAAPKDAIERLYLGFYTSYSGDFQTGESHARAALAINPSPEAYLALAEAQVGQGKLSEAIETYANLQKQGDAGASIAASGLADIYVYEGRYTEAAKMLAQGISADLAAKSPENAGDKLIALANVELLLKKKDAAVASATKALADNNSVKIRFLAAQVFEETGQAAKAHNLASGLAAELDAEPQAYAKIISADSVAQHGDYRAAIKTCLMRMRYWIRGSDILNWAAFICNPGNSWKRIPNSIAASSGAAKPSNCFSIMFPPSVTSHPSITCRDACAKG